MYKKPLIKKWGYFGHDSTGSPDFWLPSTVLSCFQTQEHLEEAKALNQQRVLEERERLKEEAAKVPTGDFLGLNFGGDLLDALNKAINLEMIWN